MRSRSVYPPVICCCILVLTAVLLAELGNLAMPGWAGSLVWSDLQGPAGGPAQALALNPNYPSDPTVLSGGGRDFRYASWAGLGIFRSLDGGLTWPERSGPPAGALLDVAISPDWQSDGFALAGLWQGVWSTSDRGVTWRQLSSLETGGPAFIAAVAVSSPADGVRTLVAGGPYGGIFRSVDDGATWLYRDGPGGIRRLRFHPRVPAVALAATGNGLWRSADAGLQWTQVTSPTQVFDVTFAGDGSTAYASFDSRIWHSSDSGLTWQPMAGLSVAFLDPIGLSADGAGLFVAAGPTLYRYDVSSAAFVTVTTNLATHTFLRLSPSPTFGVDHTLLASTYDGVWISHDGGATFARSDGFTTFPITDMEVAAGDLGGDLFAAGEYGVWRRSAGAWQPANAGIGGAQESTISDLAVSPAYDQDGTVFAAQVSSVSIGASLYKSTDRGVTWRRLAGAAYINQIALSPAFVTDRRAYMVADQRIMSSTDAGETWTLQPFWTATQTVRLLAVSRSFADNQTLVAVGNRVYRSTDGGLSWETSAVSPPLGGDDSTSWRPGHLAAGEGDSLYLSIYRYDVTPPYARRDQLWSSADSGATWTQLAGAPGLPVAALATGLSAGGGEVVYLSVFDDNENDDRVVTPDLYASRDNGVTWRNVGAVPGGAAAFALAAPAGSPDHLLAGSRGVWLLEADDAPTATPDPCQELLRNRSFETEGEWRVPVTAYLAQRSLDQHSHGWWSMRSGIVDAADNVRSYSDFSQDVALPTPSSLTLRFQRWPQGASAVSASRGALTALASAATLDEFYRMLETVTGDLQYAMVIVPPAGTIHLLYARLDDQQAWVDESSDLSAYAGETVRLQFGTFNDGVGPMAAQYFDAFSLEACPRASTTPTATAAPPTAAPPTVTPPTATPTLSTQAWLPYINQSGGGTIPPPPESATPVQ